MKKAEAISILATSVRPREAKDRARYDEAVKMAIEALKCSETSKSSERTSETAQADHIADIGKKVCVDTISRQAALKKLSVYIHLIDKTMGKGLLTDDDCMEAAKSVLGEDELPAAQPEIIRCKDCKYMIDIGDDLMCDNAKGWVVATTSDFGCVLAERRTE